MGTADGVPLGRVKYPGLESVSPLLAFQDSRHSYGKM